MKKSCLHITNGNSLTDYLRELNISEPIITWQEMLCEGPTIPLINTKFFNLRKAFLNLEYGINLEDYKLPEELKRLDNTDAYSEINLWFEYDLFCHINMIAAINLLHQKEIDVPLYLICSGRVEGEKHHKGLAELSPDQLQEHYKSKILLTSEDKALAVAIWRTYCGKDHNILKPYIVQKSNFQYLTNCLKAHLVRFPNQRTGLNRLEENILNLVKTKNIKSKHHLLGYSLNYQGFYGYGDVQLKRIIDKLSICFDTTKTRLLLNRIGHEALLGEYNIASQLNNSMTYGGVNRLHYQFSSKENRLIKTVPYAS